VWIPNRAITIDEILAALAICEDDWGAHGSKLALLLPIVLTGALLVSGVGAGLRGEEIPQINIGGLQKHWEEGTQHPRQEHVPLVLKGHFKQTVGEKLYFQPLAVCSKSGIPCRLWLHRALVVYHELGVTAGPLFRAIAPKTGKAKRAGIPDLDLLLHDIMK